MKMLALLACLLVLVGCAGTSSRGLPAKTPTPHATPTPPPPHKVRYLLTGSAESADITIQTPTGTSQQQGVDLPLHTDDGNRGLIFYGFGYGDFVYISAQNTGDYGSLTCQIEVDGTVISQNQASGAYAIASCQGQS